MAELRFDFVLLLHGNRVDCCPDDRRLVAQQVGSCDHHRLNKRLLDVSVPSFRLVQLVKLRA